jgi:hypothetical protein
MGKLVLGVVPWLFVCAPNSRRYQSRQKLLNRSGAVWLPRRVLDITVPQVSL